MTFGDLFERAARYDVDEDAVRAALVDRRSDGDGETNENDAEDGEEATHDASSSDRDPSPARVVADADVLAADLLVGGPARDALDALRSHSWTALVASDPLLDDAESVIASLADAALAADWRTAIEAWRVPIAHPADDHPALASAYRGAAMQVVSLDPSLTGPRAAAGLRDRLPVSVREPRAFAVVFSPAKLYPEAVGGEYPGPDRDPRSMAPLRSDGDQHG
ncbi:hypothetical protein C461_10458 [Halorubrum aidingense JCM 13560]|uniref:Uncharacterized protein n=1 Tax=Halorubrum aidingense JCM 13560 TaxID=1230454 RepID=M0PCA1_9EURY|nr:hypothetical protein [Halorubrum aidingense]EMA66455.1 hypothetical protein C461_10458 [Halorubrum aidingense JCM 13560]